ncbi:hypothetical protein C8Q80DRAFT_1266798 [Daedaleopsis nitida]|nr:hypothetical protein C8Q80DRAFT_1266798 [Daedaleopsis nitida]
MLPIGRGYKPAKVKTGASSPFILRISFAIQLLLSTTVTRPSTQCNEAVAASAHSKLHLLPPLLATLVAAQGAVLKYPPPKSTFSPGSSFVVEVDRPNSLTNSREVSVAIGLLSCVNKAPAGTCDGIDNSEEFGSVLYAGPYDPKLAPGTGSLVQNYTVTVPDGFQAGPAVLGVAHFNLVGALFIPSLQILNETVFIQ